MAPPIAEADLSSTVHHEYPSLGKPKPVANTPSYRPLKYSGSLDAYSQFDVTNTIGREFPSLQLSSIVHSDEQVRDLAILIAQRGVVFFRNQDLNISDQKALAHRLGLLTGKPATSGLHRHALYNSKRSNGNGNHVADDEVSVINSEQFRRDYGERYSPLSTTFASEGWHADITFENIPSDYTILKITQLSSDAGGDTLWASSYEAYDRLSPAWQKFAESLMATHYLPDFNEIARKQGEELLAGERGAPENKGLEFRASHPVVRTNPVTGWKSLFALGGQVEKGWIEGLTRTESELLKRYFLDLVVRNRKSWPRC